MSNKVLGIDNLDVVWEYMDEVYERKDNGIKTRMVFAFKTSTSQPLLPQWGKWDIKSNTISISPDWSLDAENLKRPIWMINGTFNSNVPDAPVWSSPVQISGIDGAKGADGLDMEFVYTRTQNEYQIPDSPKWKDEDDYVELPWTDSPQGISETLQVEWVCTRKKNNMGWTQWTKPGLWSKYGVDGRDGDGIEYIYLANAGAPVSNPTPTDWETSELYQKEEYVPKALGWSDEPVGVDKDTQFEWVCVRKRVDGVWNKFSNPTLWAKYGETGDPGIYQKTLYCKTDSTGTVPPVIKDNIEPGSAWGMIIPDYVFAEAVWSITAYVNHRNEFIDMGDGVYGWQGPLLISGIQGNTGTPPNYKTYIYKQSSTRPNKPSSSQKIPTGWEDYPVNSESSERWWQCIGIVDGKTESVIEWSEVTPLTGVDGSGIEIRFAVVKDGETPTYNKKNRYPNTDTTTWYLPDNIPNLTKGYVMWQIVGEIKNGLLIGEWGIPFRISGEQGPQGETGPAGPVGPTGAHGVAGIPGQGFEVQYCLGDEDDYIPGTWSEDLPTPDDSFPYIWCRQGKRTYASAEDTVGEIKWSSPFRLSGINGLNGVDGRKQMVYPAGIYDPTVRYECDEYKTPYVVDGKDGQFYFMNYIGYWLGEESGFGRTPAEDYEKNHGKFWQRFESFEAIHTKVAIINNGLIGSAVFNNEFMFSQHGINKNGGKSTDYQNFMNAYEWDKEGAIMDNVQCNWKYYGTENYIKPEDVNPYEKKDGEYIHEFMPTVCLNFVTGEVWMNTGKTNFNVDGSGYIAAENIKWDVDGDVTLSEGVSLKWASVSDREEAVMQPIANAQKAADDAQEAADNAQDAADTAQQTADQTIFNINEWSKDGILNTIEQKEIWRQGQEIVKIFRQIEKNVKDFNELVESKGEDWLIARGDCKIPVDGDSIYGKFKSLFYKLCDLGTDDTIIGGAIKYHVKGLPTPIGEAETERDSHNVEIDNNVDSPTYFYNIPVFYELYAEISKEYADKMSAYAKALSDDWTGQYFNTWADDNLINEQEQHNLADNLEQLTREYNQIKEDIGRTNLKSLDVATTYPGYDPGLINYTEFDNAWNNIKTVLEYYSGEGDFERPTDEFLTNNPNGTFDNYIIKDKQVFIKIVDYDNDENPDGGKYDWDWISNYYKQKQSILTLIAQKESEIVEKLGKQNADRVEKEANAAAKAAHDAADAAQKDATNTINKLNDWTDDDKLSPIEQKELIKKGEEIKKDYEQVLNDVKAAEKDRTGVDINTDLFTQAYEAAIDAIKYHTKKEGDEFVGVEVNNTEYGKISSYYTARQAVLNSIATELANYAQRTAETNAGKYTDAGVSESKAAAKDAQDAADAAQADMDEANQYLDTWASDGFVVKHEMNNLKDELTDMGFEHAQIISDLNKYSDTNIGDGIYIPLEDYETLEDYEKAYNNAKVAIEYHTKSGEFINHSYNTTGEEVNNIDNDDRISIKIQRGINITISGKTYNINYDNISQYYEKRQALLNELARKLSEKAKEVSYAYADGLKADLLDGQIADINKDIDKAQEDIIKAQEDATKANKNLDEWASDEYIVKQEQVNLIDKLNELQVEYDKIISDIAEYDQNQDDDWKNNPIKGSSEYSTFVLSFAKLKSSIAYHTSTEPFEDYNYGNAKESNGTIAVITGTDATKTVNGTQYFVGWDNITQYYSDRQSMLNYISKRLNEYAKVLIENTNDALVIAQVSLNDSIASLNKRLDGVVENYFLKGSPKTSELPVTEWKEKGDVEIYNHIGDTYTNINVYKDENGVIVDEDAGKSWRWCECTDTSGITDFIEVTIDGQSKKLHWHPIADSDAVKALQQAAKAQSTADGKCSTFLKKPTDLDQSGYLYRDGDLWIISEADKNDTFSSDSNVKKGDILTANQDSKTFVKDHWVKLVNYTDDTRADQAFAKAEESYERAKEDLTNLTSEIANDNIISIDEQSTLKSKLEELKKEHDEILDDIEGYDTKYSTNSYWKQISNVNNKQSSEYKDEYDNFVNGLTNLTSTINYHTSSGSFKDYNYGSNKTANEGINKYTSDIKINGYDVNFNNISEYYAVKTIILNVISENLASVAAGETQRVAEEAQDNFEKAQAAADAAQGAANAAQSTADSANTRMNSWVDDKVISKLELQGIKDEQVYIKADKSDIEKQVTRYKLTNNTNYTNLVTSYNNYLSNLDTIINGFTSSVETVTIPNDFTTNQSSYYSNRTLILNDIASAAKKVADDAQSTADTAKANAATAQNTANTAVTNAANAQKAADDAQADATKANENLENWADDKKLSPEEQKSLLNKLAELELELNIICKKIDDYNNSVSSNTDKISADEIGAFCGTTSGKDGGAWKKLVDAIEYHTNSSKDDYGSIAIDEDTYGDIAAYYSARQTMLDLISKKYADRALADAKKHNISISKFTSTAFKRTNDDISNTQPTGGDFNSPIPEGWKESIPDGEEILWATTRVWYADDELNASENWAAPRKMTDTSTFDVEFSSVENNPGDPTTNPSNWSNTSNNNTIWMATRTVNNGVEGTWQVSKIKGEDGSNGTSLTMKGEVTSLPTSNRNIGDSYILTTDKHLYTWSGSEWIDCGKVKGEDGADGRGIVSTSISYAVADQGNNAANISESSWKPTLQTANPGQYLWTRTIIDYTTGDDTVSYSVSYISKNGEKGDTGANGTSVTVSSITYLAGQSNTQVPSGTWLPNPPSVEEGQYLWTKTTFSDGNEAYSIAKQGSDGATTYLHIKYANKIVSGALNSGIFTEFAWTTSKNLGFTGDLATIVFTGPGTVSSNPQNLGEEPGPWMGVCTTNSIENPNGSDPLLTVYSDASKYKWTKIKGEDGETPDIDAAVKTAVGEYNISSNHIAGKTMDNDVSDDGTKTPQYVTLAAGTEFVKFEKDAETGLDTGRFLDANGNGTDTKYVFTSTGGTGIESMGPSWQIRNDGAGHFSKGNIRWDNNGNLTVNGTINGEIGTKAGDKLGIWNSFKNGTISYIGDNTTIDNCINYFGSDGTFKLGGNSGIIKNSTGIQFGTLTNGFRLTNAGALSFGSNVKLSWDKITGTDNIATKDDVENSGWSTEIGNEWIKTAEVTCQNLTVQKVNTLGDGYGNNIVIEDNTLNAYNGDKNPNLTVSGSEFTQVLPGSVSSDYDQHMPIDIDDISSWLENKSTDTSGNIIYEYSKEISLGDFHISKGQKHCIITITESRPYLHIPAGQYDTYAEEWAIPQVLLYGTLETQYSYKLYNTRFPSVPIKTWLLTNSSSSEAKVVNKFLGTSMNAGHVSYKSSTSAGVRIYEYIDNSGATPILKKTYLIYDQASNDDDFELRLCVDLKYTESSDSSDTFDNLRGMTVGLSSTGTNISVLYQHSIDRTDIGSNGFRTAFDSLHYVEFAEYDGNSSMLLYSKNAGIKITDDNVYIRIGGKWYSLNATYLREVTEFDVMDRYGQVGGVDNTDNATDEVIEDLT